MSRRIGAGALVVLGILLAVASSAAAQGPTSTHGPRFLLAAWAGGNLRDASNAPVLQRRVTLEIQDGTLDEAIKAIIERADLEIIYSSRVIPLHRRVSIHASDVTVASAMGRLLAGLPVDVSVTEAGGLAIVRRDVSAGESADSGSVVGQVTDSATGAPLFGATVSVAGTRLSSSTNADGRYRITGVPVGDQRLTVRYIGYRPTNASVVISQALEAVGDVVLTKSAQELDQVVVTGTIIPTEVKALPTPITVVTSEDLKRENLQRIDQVFRGLVPSGVAWDLGQNDYSSVIGVRGTTSLATVSTIKTYIDGVEVADPVMLATIDPSTVERIEVARGPQASTLYGSDASGGVMQIFTKRGSFDLPAQLSLRAEVGVMGGSFAEGTPLRQDYGLEVRGGGSQFRYNAGATFANVGEWTPGYYSRTPGFFAGGEWTQGALTLSLLARRTSKDFATVNSPLLSNLTFFSRPAYQSTTVDQRTFGLTATYRTTPRWTHALTLGQDETDYDFVITRPRLTTPADTFLQRGSQEVSRVSVRYHTTYDWQVASAINATLTAGAEYYDADLGSSFTFNATHTSSILDGTTVLVRNPRENTGYFGQVMVGLDDAVYLTAGLRGERNTDFGDAYGTAWSPRVGLSYLRSVGSVRIKSRASYGNAIRAPLTNYKSRVQDTFTNQLANSLLAPERQRGWDAGIEASWGSTLFLGVTYYSQLADDLIDVVTVDPGANPPATQYQNVGQIKNSGWELEGRLQLRRVGFQASFSRPSSTVQRVSPTYGGNLRIGDPLLGIPRDILGVTLTYAPTATTNILFGLSRFGPWTGSDNLALWQVYYGNAEYRGSLRDYWIRYPSVAKMKLSVSQRLTNQLTGLLRIDNLGNNQRFEEQNLNIPMGRVVQFGATAEF